MKPKIIIWTLTAFMSCLIIACIVSCKEKKTNITSSTSTSSEYAEFLNESDLITEVDFKLDDYSEQTNDKQLQEIEQQSDDDINIPDENPNDMFNLFDIVPIEFSEQLSGEL